MSSTRLSGSAPYWQPGTQICWRYRRPGWRPGDPEGVQPATVVRDDARALVAWLAPDTPILRTIHADGTEIRSVPVAERFSRKRAPKRDIWHGSGTLRVAPTGVPWSVWLFWSAGWVFNDFYVNLERRHTRAGRDLYTADHVLDVVVTPDGRVRWKDEDELESAVAAARFTAAEAAGIRDDAREVEGIVARWGSPFCDGWERWRPDPSWPIPTLPT